MNSTLTDYESHLRSIDSSDELIRRHTQLLARLARELDVINADEAEILEWMRSQGWSATTMATARSSIRHFYRWLQRQGRVLANPLPDHRQRELETIGERSREILEEYDRYVRSESDSAATIRQRAYYALRLAAAVDLLDANEVDIERWLRSHGWSPTSVNSATASLRHLYRWLERYGYVDKNPTRYLRRLREPRKMGRIADEEKILNGYHKSPVDTRVMILLGAECGLRRSEIAQVHNDDIQGEWLHIVGKGGHERDVYLSPQIRDLMRRLPQKGWLFPGQGGDHLRVDTVYKRIRRATGLNPHSLRHRAGTTVYERTGNNLRLAQEFLGHANPTHTARYVHVRREDLRYASQSAQINLDPAHAPAESAEYL